jgi:hypothetical protein
MRKLLPLLFLAGCGQQVAGTYVVDVTNAGGTCQPCSAIGGTTFVVVEHNDQTVVSEAALSAPAQIDGDRLKWTWYFPGQTCSVAAVFDTTVDGGNMDGTLMTTQTCGAQMCTCKYDIKS